MYRFGHRFCPFFCAVVLLLRMAKRTFRAYMFERSSRAGSFKDLSFGTAAKPASKRRLSEAATMLFVFAIPVKREKPPTSFHIALPSRAFVILRK